jgi:alpha-N-arabinofuranosidase
MLSHTRSRTRIFAPFSKLLLVGSLCLSVTLFAQDSQPPATLEINVATPVAKVSPMLYGLMTEEINYSYDGGLYAELVRNRAFQAGRGELAHWFLAQYGNSRAAMQIDSSTGPSANRQVSLKLTVTQADPQNHAGVENEGYWGIPALPNTAYQGSFFAKADSESVGPVTMSIVADDTGKVVATASSPALTTDWKQYNVTLKTADLKVSAANHLELTVAHPGVVWLDMVSLFPPTYKDRVNGNRVDLMEKLAAMRPAFLRFPGGNYLEGEHIPDRFDWKKTIGPMVDRPTHLSPWRYRSSDGMGLLEFLEWCEDLHMQPVLAVYAGYSLAQEHVKPGPDLEPYVQDALDEIEYLTGGASTQWGAVRAKNGHPAPFALTYVEIGNEDNFDKSGSYDDRYAQFYKAIKDKYPQLQLIATAPVKGIRPDVIDDHYYRRADQFYEMLTHYDKVDRNGPKIFIGEWATREGSPTPNFGAALGDAAWMTSMERNSDLIVMASYAPLLVNVNPGGMQWESDLIGYDALNSYGSPSYYAQVMFANHIGTEILDAKSDGGGPRFFYSVTRDPGKGIVYLKVVNASSAPQQVNIKLTGANRVKSRAKMITLSARTTAETNSISESTKIVPVETEIAGAAQNFSHTFAPYSISIIEVEGK